MSFLFSALMILNENMADLNVALPSAWSGLLQSSTALKKREKSASWFCGDCEQGFFNLVKTNKYDFRVFFPGSQCYNEIIITSK